MEGLGLVSVKAVTEKLNGQVWVGGTPGVICVFTFPPPVLDDKP